ncbi:MAG: TIGR04086 family membrane protein [Clostridium sp.]
MKGLKFLKSLSKGLIRSLFLVLLFLIILSVFMMKIEISEKSYKILYSIILSHNIVRSHVKNESKGLLIGIILGVIFFFLTNLMVGVIKGNVLLQENFLIYLILDIFLGGVSGVLGVNL